MRELTITEHLLFLHENLLPLLTIKGGIEIINYNDKEYYVYVVDGIPEAALNKQDTNEYFFNAFNVDYYINKLYEHIGSDKSIDFFEL